MVDDQVTRAVRDTLGAQPRRVLVTGGSGFVGSHLARALARAGHAVVCTGRNRYRAGAPAHPNIRFVEADVRDRAAVLRLCAGQDIVYHSAALASPWAPPSLLAAVNVGGTRNVVGGCLAHDVGRLVHVSSTAIFFDFRDRLNVPDEAPRPRRSCCPYATSKAEAEMVVGEGVGRGLNAFIVRARAVVGPGDNALLPRLLRAARAGRLRQIGGGRNVVDLTYIDNVVYALALAAVRGAAGGACTVTNGEPVELWPALRRVLGELGLGLPRRPVPYRLALAAAGLLEALHAAFPGRGEPVMTRYTVGLLAKSQTFDGAAARRELGYEPLVPVGEGIRRTVEALRARAEGPARTAVRLRLFSTGWTRHSEHYVHRGAARVKVAFHAAFAVLEHPEQGVTLFDTGYAPRFFEAAGRFPYSLYARATPVETADHLSAVRTLGRLGIGAGEVRRVVVSHFHADHVCGLKDFPRADFVVSARAWEAVRGKRGLAAVRRGFLPDLLPADFADRVRPVEHFHDPGMGPFAAAHDLFGDGSVRLFDLPGHAVGQIGALVQTGPDERKFLVADAVWTGAALRAGAMPHPITRLFLASFEDLRATLGLLGEFRLRYPEVEIIPTHCPEVARRYAFPSPDASRSGRVP